MGFFLPPHVTTFQASPLLRGAAFKPRENRGIQPAGAKRNARLRFLPSFLRI